MVPVCISPLRLCLPAFPPPSNQHLCGHITLMVHFIKMNESHPRDAFLHFTAEYFPPERGVGAQLSPWRAWQDLPAGHLADVSSQSRWKRFVTPTKQLQHDSVTLSVWGRTMPSRLHANKSQKENKWRGWRWGSVTLMSSEQNAFELADMMRDTGDAGWKARGVKDVNGLLPGSCSDIRVVSVFQVKAQSHICSLIPAGPEAVNVIDCKI